MSKWFAVSTLALSVALAGCLSNSSSSRSNNGNQPEPTPTPQNISLSKLGSYSSGQYGVSAAEIPAFDPVNKRIFIVNAQSGKVDVLDAADPQNLARAGELATGVLNATINSISYHDGLLAVAVESSPKTANGFVELYDATTLELLDSTGVGALPDMLTFTPDGKYVLVANEGEPNDDYSVDPEGSVSVVEVVKAADGTSSFGANRTAGFEAFNADKDDLIAKGVRIYGPADNTQPYGPANTTTVARDMEPEYITVSEDGTTAWVALQENNAFAKLDIASATITEILPLGYKDYGVEGNAIDASDEDGLDPEGEATTLLNFQLWPGVVGMYHPDAISSYSANGKTYIVSANEGDARAWGEDDDAYWGGDRSKGFVEEFRLKHLVHHNADGFERRAGNDMPQQLRDLAKGAMLDPAVFDYCGAGETAGRSGGCREDFAAADGTNASGLGRLNISWVQGYHTHADGSPKYYTRAGVEDASLTSADGYLMYHTLYSYGARSFSIWDENGDQVWDSGDFFEKFLADQTDFECGLGAERKINCLDFFNSGHDEGSAFDSRSDAKGPEPEGIAVGKIGEQTFAFIGLERMGGVMVFDITDPQQPLFQDYLNARENWVDEPEDLFDEDRLEEAGDLGPEGLVFVSAEDSPTEQPLLIVGNEVSGTTTVFQIDLADRTE
ncbi:choice-of-anchor I family protein [Halopseudomonas xiamenensis]|uniref:choice-of-anchor I family protein n=1 Tax=Halopseudomonas xiamenensis TaxID=157792 RepID=UPI00162A1099|nr:choice-of-anchor I family protein [Halopseudomonas xiamenensis]